MKPETRSFYAEAVQRTIDRIVQNLDDALDLETLADQACLSPFHFHRVFRGMVGETPLELIRRLRMERAAWRLSASRCAVTEIAFDAGYDTHEAFTRAFRTSYSTSPSGFRQRKYPRIELAATCGVHFDVNGRVPPFMPRDSGGHLMDVTLKTMPELRLATVRHVGPYNQIPHAFERLGALASQAALPQRADTMMIAIYHDDPESVPQDELRSDAAITIPDSTPLPDGLAEQHLPAGRYASTVHVGPYEQLGDAWARFMGEWLPASGHRLGPGASYEVYQNDPRQVPKEQLRTEMLIPIE